MKKGIVTKGGRFRPDRMSLRTLSGPVLLHRSSVNRFECVPKVIWRKYRIYLVVVNHVVCVIFFSSCHRGKGEFPSRWLTFFSAVKSNGNVFVRDSSMVHPLALLLLTDCDITERGKGMYCLQSCMLNTSYMLGNCSFCLNGIIWKTVIMKYILILWHYWIWKLIFWTISWLTAWSISIDKWRLRLCILWIINFKGTVFKKWQFSNCLLIANAAF